MKSLIIEETKTTPKIILDPGKNVFEISGVTMPENVQTFYYPVLEWLEKFKTKIVDEKNFIYDKVNPLNFKMNLYYFNSTSAKFLYDILNVFKDLQTESQHVKIHWFFQEEDEDMREAGEEMSEIVGISFHYVAIRSDD
jgi:hypothetical protein